MTLLVMFALIWLHFLGDFPLQNDKMALNKSKSLGWLTVHAGTYGLPFLLFFMFAALVPDPFFPLKFYLLTCTFHWVIDLFTSKINSYLWRKERRHDFFTMIGFDQALHLSVLILTYLALTGG